MMTFEAKGGSLTYEVFLADDICEGVLEENKQFMSVGEQVFQIRKDENGKFFAVPCFDGPGWISNNIEFYTAKELVDLLDALFGQYYHEMGFYKW